MAEGGGYSARSKGEGGTFAPKPSAEEMAAQIQRQYLAESCVDCGEFGPYGDGKFFYCRDHAPGSLRFPAKFIAQRQGGERAG